jgi:biopolymer transport protein ExbB
VFEENERKLGDLQKQLDDRLGSLKELFGVIQQVAGDARATFQQSIISAQFPDRGDSLTQLIEKVSGGSRLPSIEEIENLWYQIQREMTQSGKVVTFSTEVILPDGAREERDVVRVGTFNLVSDGKYLQYLAESGDVAELIRQPAGRFLGSAADIQAATGSDSLVGFAVDPSRGSILGLLVQAPSLSERVDQGGLVGYVTLAIGAIGMLLAAERIIFLLTVGRKVQAQVKSDRVNTNNPLGRVLSVYEDNKGVDVETLELKLDEAIMKEMPPLERFLGIIKIISAVAPLLGLLGTVTGMIQTFQAMTLFGTGDPKLMAGGISQALVTTVIGLVVALPTLFLHSMVAGWSKRIVHTLEEQSAGIIAVHAEQEHKGRTGA